MLKGSWWVEEVTLIVSDGAGFSLKRKAKHVVAVTGGLSEGQLGGAVAATGWLKGGGQHLALPREEELTSVAALLLSGLLPLCRGVTAVVPSGMSMGSSQGGRKRSYCRTQGRKPCVSSILESRWLIPL